LATELCFAIPGDIETLTGGYGYDRRLIAGLRARGWTIRHLALGPSFPFPDQRDLSAAARDLAGLAAGSLVLVDGLAFGALPEIAAAEGERLRLVALVHHPLADETGLSAAAAAALRESERRALAGTRGVIATSATTAGRLVAAYGVAPDRLAIARPGSDPAASPERRSSPGEPVGLLSIGTLTHRKGHDLLIEALARLAGLPWRCRIVGSADRAPAVAEDLRRRIAGHGLQPRIRLAGETADLAPCYRAADVFVLASRHEGYGMVFAEAMQQGLPIIATTAGAIPETVPPGAGLLVPPEDVSALTEALRRLICDPAERRRYAAGARAAALSLSSWEDTAQAVAVALRRFGDFPLAPLSGGEGNKGITVAGESGSRRARPGRGGES
jgi:glycosyltransferase involved in cell wall biosynthesis